MNNRRITQEQYEALQAAAEDRSLTITKKGDALYLTPIVGNQWACDLCEPAPLLRSIDEIMTEIDYLQKNMHTFGGGMGDAQVQLRTLRWVLQFDRDTETTS